MNNSKEKIIISGIEVIPPKIICKNCGCVDEPDMKLLESNKAMQMKCQHCGTFLGNCRYAKPETFVMPFGKYKGERLIDIPKNYLEWLYFEFGGLNGNLKESIKSILEDRG